MFVVVLKGKSEDSLEEIADLLRLPAEYFRVREPEDELHEYTLFSRHGGIRRGLNFGPYKGRRVEEKEGGQNIVKVKGCEGEDLLFALEDDCGGWLKLLRPGASCDTCNAELRHDESSIWCTITSDIESDTELLVDYRQERPASPARRTHSKQLFHRSNKQQRVDESRRHRRDVDAYRESEESDEDRAGDMRRRTPQYCEESSSNRNGTLLTDNNSLKYEPGSPVSPISSAASPRSSVGSKNDLSRLNGLPEGICLPYLNGCGYPPAFPYGASTTDSMTDGHFKCETCEISFNSQRILEVHRAYYCQGKSFATALSSDTDTEDTASNTKTDSRTNGSPAPCDETETNLQKHDTSAKTTIQPERTPSGDSSMVAKRRRTTSQNESLGPKLPRIFKCPYCSYSSDKKASLTRHVRMHGTSPNVDGYCDLPLATPPMARYCANCDIQFASYKNFQVHKDFYCNTRHVQKSINQPSSPTPGQQQSQQQPTTQPAQQQQQPQSPDNTPSTSEPATSKSFNNMILNQPLYAAISTSPLILVPCSYVAGGGLSPAAGLIPAGNIIIPNSSTTPDTGSDSQNVIPTFTMVAGNVAESPPAVTGEEKVKEDGKGSGKEKLRKEEAENVGKEDGEKPLDLSFRKKDEDDVKRNRMKLSLDAGSNSNCTMTSSSSSSSEENSTATTSLPPLPLISPVTDLSVMARSQLPILDSSAASIPPVLVPPSVLVKQGTSKCVECNIVFYRHENYLVHKKRYCASRLQPKNEDDSSDRVKSDDPQSPERDEAASRGTQKSPISSPRINNSRTPPTTDPENSRETSPNHQLANSAAMLQYFCMACGIKYTSIDNLRAHQLYYCPKRDLAAMALVPPFNNRNSNQDFKCGKCKNAYPSEELLRQHPCVVQRKCPYCDVYCPTLSAAQRHLVTHTGIKSFRCSLCGYKGHTLRGMRTHIRIHLDKNSSTPEEAYILCMDEGGTEIGCASRKSSGARANTERIKSVIATEPPHSEVAISPLSSVVLPSDVVAIKAVPDDPVAMGDTTHWCQICGYSSSYKGNVVRHVKLVHKDLVATQTMSTIVNSRPSVETGLKHNSDSVEHLARDSSSVSAAEHSNSSSSQDVKPVVNGLIKVEQQPRPDEKTMVLKTESISPPPPTENVGSPKGVKRPLSEEGQCPSGSFGSKAGPKYCKSCDISFNYLSNFIAHKKFYCTMRPGDIAGQEASAVQSVQ